MEEGFINGFLSNFGGHGGYECGQMISGVLIILAVLAVGLLVVGLVSWLFSMVHS